MYKRLAVFRWFKELLSSEGSQQIRSPWAPALPEPQKPLPELLTTISKEIIHDLPLAQYHGPIHIINNDKDLPKAVKKLSKAKVLGFDTETRPSFRRGEYYPTAVVQFASESEVYLIQLRGIRKPELMRPILENAKILKTGVALSDDIRKLDEVFSFQGKGFVDVSAMAQRLGIMHTGLRNLSAILMGVKVSKTAQISNWSLPVLTQSQITYAAIDAWISRQLYLKLHDIYRGKHPESILRVASRYGDRQQ